MIDLRPLRRLVITLDAENYSGRDLDGQGDIQTGIAQVLHAAGAEQRMHGLDWDRQPQGDAVLAVLPPGAVEAEAVSDFIGALYTALHHHNRSRNEAYRLRVRASVDQGNIARADSGFAGNAVVSACRVRDSDLLRDMLRTNPHADLVVAVSDSVYTDVVAHGDHELYRWSFEPALVEAKNGFSARVWVHVPEAPNDTREPHDSTPSDDRGRAASITFEKGVDARGSQGANFGSVEGDLNNRFGAPPSL
ncbi:hypothetical protein [Nocardiopsis sp. LOL_012]|uniref:hypothetical protein n=1 Tax=Nocardiopsis sp. LOL_012 TaxID=3345409 RepID=UPI003A87CFC5